MSIGWYRLHPILRMGIVLFLLRAIALFLRFLIVDGPDVFSWGHAFAIGVLYRFGETFVLAALLLLVWNSVGLLRPLVALIAAILFPAFLIAAMADLIVFQIIGDHLTPSLFRQFVGPSLFVDTDFWQPVLANWMPILAALVLIFGYFAWCLRAALRAHRQGEAVPSSALAVIAPAGLAVAVLWLAYALSPRSADQPVGVAYALEQFGFDGVTLVGGEDAAVERLRSFVGLPEGREWIADRYPLVHGPSGAMAIEPPATEALPDIVVVTIESLRAQEIGYVNGPNDKSATPNMDRLAAESIVFPFHISNAFPSGPGFTSLTASIWPHYRKRVISDFHDLRLDSLPQRLKSLGYHAVHVEDGPNFDMTSIWLEKFFDRNVDPKTRNSDKKIFAAARKTIAEWDAKHPNVPLYIQVKTETPHMPYYTPDAPPPDWMTSTSLQRNYRHNIAYVDRHLGNFVDYLKSRERYPRTILIVTGDHANYIDQKDTTSLPINDTVWVSMLLHGPVDLVGEPRTVRAPSGHVDIMPTVLGLIGDHRPTAGIGRDLLRQPRNGLWALAVRGGGVRLDMTGQSVYIDRRAPWSRWIEPSFPGLLPPDAQARAAIEKVGERLYDVIYTWSYLIEQDRVWDPDFLNPR